MNLQLTLLGGPADLTRTPVDGWVTDWYVHCFEPADFPITDGAPIPNGAKVKLRRAHYIVQEIAPRVLVGIYQGDV